MKKAALARKVGVVSKFDEMRGVGYILADDGLRCFVRRSDIETDGGIVVGARVKFTVLPRPLGPKAIAVRPC